MEVDGVPDTGSQEKTSGENKRSNFEIILEMRNFEITQLAQRNNFFMIAQGVMLAGVAQSSHQIPIVSFMICLAGLAISLLQVGMASGAKFWQEYWEAELSKCNSLFHERNQEYCEVVGDRLRKRGSSGLVYRLIMCRFSASRIPIYVGIALVCVWGLLLLSTMRAYPPLSVPSFITGFSCG